MLVSTPWGTLTTERVYPHEVLEYNNNRYEKVQVVRIIIMYEERKKKVVGSNWKSVVPCFLPILVIAVVISSQLALVNLPLVIVPSISHL